MTLLVNDVYRFLIFYAPFQFAYAFAYYLLFQDCLKQESCDASAFDSISQSFITTYLVMLQQFDTGSFDQLQGAQYVVGYILLLSHTTLVMVMLLNVLVAMLSKSVEDILERAKQEALCSFAECVLRCEKTIGIQNIPEEYLPKKLVEIQNSSSTQSAKPPNEKTPLLKSEENIVSPNEQTPLLSSEDTVKAIIQEIANLQEKMNALTKRLIDLHDKDMVQKPSNEM
ncbi:hypothetical protein THRCLA_10437 [Thraustotheca clavata]|uniref:Ion transport domain-containing protein n=1 Tax=Thraustotheca clavata TaxID=74557 RepID=A0A1V9YPQ5_9STRA|nr:hypothetical protein THRCLA_10437 [Thraustotheca clavata]